MNRRGLTLVELIVALAIMAVILAVAPVALRSVAVSQPGWRDSLSAIRRASVRGGVPVSGYFDSTGKVTAFPGGVLLSDSVPMIWIGEDSL